MRFRMNDVWAYAFIIAGASFWGMTGLFVQNLYPYGFSAWDVVAIRLTASTILIFTLLGLLSRSYLKIKLRHIPYFCGLGIVSIALFNWCYFAVMEQASLSIAVIFVYTSPVFAAVIARIFYRERITGRKTAAIIFTVFGCSLVIGFFPAGGMVLSGTTVLLGLFSGFFCSLYSIIGKHVSSLYHPVTITAYSMLCGCLFTLPTSSLGRKTESFQHPEVWGVILGLTTLSTIVAYTLYTIGLTYAESSKAVILSSFELLVSILIGIAVFHDNLTGWQAGGFLFVLLSLFLTVWPGRKKKWNRARKEVRVKSGY